MTDRDTTYAKILPLIDPFNKKGVEISGDTRFAQDLEWDSLTVMDFVASVEDEFDILISMNRAAEVGQRDVHEDAESPRALRVGPARLILRLQRQVQRAPLP